MSIVAAINGDQAWVLYQDIVRVIETRYQRFYLPTNTSMALQRLGEAVLNRYRLNPQDYQVTKRWNLTLRYPHPDTTRLSTTQEMIRARIIQWECAIESVQVGHDVWTEGRSAAFRPQKSLQETLTLDYFEIKVIVDTTSKTAWGIFLRIQEVVQIELNRLESKETAREKREEIGKAVQCLAAAVAYKYKTLEENPAFLSDEEKAYVDAIDLYSFNTMFDAKIKKWSLRQALNLSSDSLASKLFGLQEALWGKATALQNVEKTL
jgi:hypothetical protein